MSDDSRGTLWKRICMGGATAVCLFAALSYTGSLESRARWRMRPFWSSAERDQEAGILDPVLFRESLYSKPDREINVWTVEPTAPHTHSIVILHGLYNVAPHVDHISAHWAAHHPGIRWFLPQATGVNVDDTGVPGWYNPWLGGLKDIWSQVSDDFFNATLTNQTRIDLKGEYGDMQAYSSSEFFEDERGLTRSCRRIWDVITSQVIGEGEGKVSWDKLIIGGFSQGGFMTLVLATTMPQIAAGYMVYSGYLPLRTHPRRLAFNAGKPTIHWVQGDRDELFHPPLVNYSIGVLHELGYQDITLSWQIGMGHWFGPSEEQTASMNRLIEKVFGPGV